MTTLERASLVEQKHRFLVFFVPIDLLTSVFPTFYTVWVTFALHRPRLIVEPAQFRTSVAKRCGSGLSLNLHDSLRYVSIFGANLPHNVSTIDADNKVEPRFDCQLRIAVAQDLKPIAGCSGLLSFWLGVQTRNESIQCPKYRHDGFEELVDVTCRK